MDIKLVLVSLLLSAQISAVLAPILFGRDIESYPNN